MTASDQDAPPGWRKAVRLRRSLPLIFVFFPAAWAGQNPVSSRGDTSRVDANLVLLHATVRDRRGNLVAGLREEDSRVCEDGQPQTIRVFQHEDAPVAAGLIVDNITVYALCVFDEFAQDRNSSILKTIACASGGDSFLPHYPSEMAVISRRIAKELRSQYTVGCMPSRRPLDHPYKTLKVSARGQRREKFAMRAIDGYIASPHLEGER